MIVIMKLDEEDLNRVDLSTHEAFLQMLMLDNESFGMIVQKSRGHREETMARKRGLIRCGAEVLADARRGIWGVVTTLCDIFGGG